MGPEVLVCGGLSRCRRWTVKKFNSTDQERLGNQADLIVGSSCRRQHGQQDEAEDDQRRAEQDQALLQEASAAPERRRVQVVPEF